MLVYRVASRKYSADNSEGARLYGGRWNKVGTSAIYTSATISLAALEVIANKGAIPADYRVLVVEIPSSLSIEAVASADLPSGWPDETSRSETADRGSEWASSFRTSVLRVPSGVIPAEHNYILNPQHPDFGTIKFDVANAEYIDQRLRTK